MPARSLSSVDLELSEAVKARSEATKSISQLSQSVVYNTKKIDQLLAERSELVDTAVLESIIAAPVVKPKAKNVATVLKPVPPAKPGKAVK